MGKQEQLKSAPTVMVAALKCVYNNSAQDSYNRSSLCAVNVKVRVNGSIQKIAARNVKVAR